MGTSPPSVPLPVSIVPPSVAGSPQVGGLLSCSAGTWANGPTGFGFAWLRDGQAIPGATGFTYFGNDADLADNSPAA